jgi:hypothetical protein
MPFRPTSTPRWGPARRACACSRVRARARARAAACGEPAAPTPILCHNLNPPPPKQIPPGTWQHDLAQAALLERHPNVSLKAFSHDSHRLALALARGGKLAPLLREAIANEAGLPSRNVRVANML